MKTEAGSVYYGLVVGEVRGDDGGRRCANYGMVAGDVFGDDGDTGTMEPIMAVGSTWREDGQGHANVELKGNNAITRVSRR